MTDDDFLPEVPWKPSSEISQVVASDRSDQFACSPSSAELAQMWGSWNEEYVDDKKAMTIAAFYAGVCLICEAMAVMPIKVYKNLKSGGWDWQDQHVVNYCLNKTNNGWQTPSVYKSEIQSHLIFGGNSVSVITRNGRGQGIALKPYLPVNVKFQLEADDTPSYGLRDYPLADMENMIYSYGSRSPSYDKYYFDEVLHIKNFSTNGYVGLSTLKQARSSLKLSLTVDRFGHKIYSKGRPAGWVTRDGKLTKAAKQQIRDEWHDLQEGVENAFNVGILSGGLKWQAMGYTADDAQYLQTRNFQVLEVARWLRIPPHMLAELTKATNSNIEQLMLEFIMFTLMPWVTRWEEEINLKMFTPKEQAMGYVALFDTDAWLRGDTITRAKVEEAQLRNGTRTIDEVREKSHLAPYAEGIGAKPLIMASQLDTLENVIDGTSKLHGTDQVAAAKSANRQSSSSSSD